MGFTKIDSVEALYKHFDKHFEQKIPFEKVKDVYDGKDFIKNTHVNHDLDYLDRVWGMKEVETTLFTFNKEKGQIYSMPYPELDRESIVKFMNGDLSKEATMRFINDNPNLFNILRTDLRDKDLCKELLNSHYSKDTLNTYTSTSYHTILNAVPHMDVVLNSLKQYYEDYKKIPDSHMIPLDFKDNRELIHFCIDKDKDQFNGFGRFKDAEVCLYQMKVHPDTDIRKIPLEVREGMNVYTLNNLLENLTEQKFQYNDIINLYNGTGTVAVKHIDTLTKGILKDQNVSFDKSTGKFFFLLSLISLKKKNNKMN